MGAGASSDCGRSKRLSYWIRLRFSSQRRWTASEVVRIEGSGDCEILEASRRGITLDQLKCLHAFACWKREDEEWTSPEPGGATSARSVLPGASPCTSPTMQEIDLYIMVERVIKPVTKPRLCSYVEFTCFDPAAQNPSWFVSHWWGEPVHCFITGLELFRRRRGLPEHSAYWVCAYALRQHQLGLEIGSGDPLEEPFAKVLGCPDVMGTVVMMDEQLIVYGRAWCCFETVLTICMEKPLDLVVTQSDKPYIIADSSLPCDDADADAQAPEDNEFPLQVLEKGMDVIIELSTTSRIADKNRILNAIVGRVSSSAPAIFHTNYDFYNAQIRTNFAVVMLRVAMAKGNVDAVRRALRQCPTASQKWLETHGRSLAEAAELLAQTHPEQHGLYHDIVAYCKEADQHNAASGQNKTDSGQDSPVLKIIASPSRRRVAGASRRPSSVDQFLATYGNSSGERRPSGVSPVSVRNSFATKAGHGATIFTRFVSKHIKSRGAIPEGTQIEVAQADAPATSRRNRRTSFSDIFSSFRRATTVVEIPNVVVESASSGHACGAESESVADTSASSRLLHVARLSKDLPERLHNEHLLGSVLPAEASKARYGRHLEIFLPNDADEEYDVNNPSPTGSSRSSPGGSPGHASDTKSEDQFVSMRLSASRSHVLPILAQMAAQPTSEDVQAEFCRALCNLALRDAEYQDSVAFNGGIRAVATAMRSHPDSPIVQMEACRAIWSITTGNTANREKAIAAALVVLLESATHAFPENAFVQREARLALRELS